MDTRIAYPRIDIFGGQGKSQLFQSAGESIRRVLMLRKSYTNHFVSDVNVEDVFKQTKFDESIWEYNNYYGVVLLSRIGRPPPWPHYIPTLERFIEDMNEVRKVVVGHSDVARLASHRLDLLEHKFKLHLAMNIGKEAGSLKEKETNNRDIFTAHKVDNHVHTNAGMNSRTLLDFFVEKATSNGHDVVLEEAEGEPVMLRQQLERLRINPSALAVDELHFLVQHNQQIRSIFLATENFLQGRYFAELTKRTLELYKLDESTFSESRLQLQGSSRDEWGELALWFDRYGMASSQNKWMVSLPRNYRKLRQQRVVLNFAQYLDNLFQPLWEVSLHPAQNPKFHYFLTHVSGLDCVDDESKVDLPLTTTEPHKWSSDLNPPYSYYLYYYWANVVSLNSFRASRGLSTLTFRPQCGELGDVDHLISGFLLASSINHGVTLRHFPVMEYLYYITQIPIAMSPLSNTRNGIDYLGHPFPRCFARGLRVSLSTDQPLFTHFTREPLLEEYSTASKIWTLEFNDLCEIARNSVLQSGFSQQWKERALGSLYYLHSTLGNDVERSHVSDIRVAYRFEVYHTELNFLDDLVSASSNAPAATLNPRAMLLLEEEVDVYERSTGKRVRMPDEAASGDASVTDAGPGGEPATDPAAVAAKVRLDVAALQRELLQAKVSVHQLMRENENVAGSIKRIRTRLMEEPLAIRAGLGGDYVNEIEELEELEEDDEYAEVYE